MYVLTVRLFFQAVHKNCPTKKGISSKNWNHCSMTLSHVRMNGPIVWNVASREGVTMTHFGHICFPLTCFILFKLCGSLWKDGIHARLKHGETSLRQSDLASCTKKEHKMCSKIRVAATGIEPVTQGLWVPCSTDWATPPCNWLHNTRISYVSRGHSTSQKHRLTTTL